MRAYVAYLRRWLPGLAADVHGSGCLKCSGPCTRHPNCRRILLIMLSSWKCRLPGMEIGLHCFTGGARAREQLIL